MRVLVCGGRGFNDNAEVDRVLSAIQGATDVIISGMAAGADFLAAQWAQAHNIELLQFPANWHKHGKAAGPIRNQQMIDEGKPTIVIAFPGGRGTADMVERAKKAGIKTVLVN